MDRHPGNLRTVVSVIADKTCRPPAIEAGRWNTQGGQGWSVVVVVMGCAAAAAGDEAGGASLGVYLAIPRGSNARRLAGVDPRLTARDRPLCTHIRILETAVDQPHGDFG